MNRNEIQQLIEENVFDNVNKEILASMVRLVFQAIKDGYFNLEEDQLANLNYNNTQTLQQVFNSLAVTRIGVLGAYNLGQNGSVNVDIDGGFIENASVRQINGPDYVITINCNQNISNRIFYFSYKTDASGDAGLDSHNDFFPPSYRITTTTTVDVAIRTETGASGNRNFLNIFMI